MKFLPISTIALVTVLTLPSKKQGTNAAALRANRSLQQSHYVNQVDQSLTDLAKDVVQTMVNLLSSTSSFISQSRTLLNLDGNYGINLSFESLSIVQLSCQPVELVDRLKIHYTALKRFSAPLRSILRQIQGTSSRRSLLSQVRMNFNALMMTFKKILTRLRVQYTLNPSSSSLSITEMDRITRDYLRLFYPGVHPSDIRKYRDLAFAYSLFSVVATVRHEFDLLLLV